MAINLVELVRQYVTPQISGRIADTLGLDRSKVETAIGAALPGLLASFCTSANRIGGAQVLAKAVRQHVGATDEFIDIVGRGGQESFADRGSKTLNSLLGSEEKSELAAAVAKFSGLGQPAAESILGMITPIALATIGKEFGPRGPNANGLADLLDEQKDKIAAAIPAGFDEILFDTGILNTIGGVTTTSATARDAAAQAARAATEDAEETAHYAYSAARYVADTTGSAAERTGGSSRWALWAIPLALAAGGFVWMFSSGPPETKFASTAPPVTVAALDINQQLDQSLGTLKTSLQGITDTASATAALPKLQAATIQVGKVSAMVGNLSPDARRLIAGLDAQSMGNLNQLFDKTLAIPGVSEVIKPTIDSLKQTLASLAT